MKTPALACFVLSGAASLASFAASSAKMSSRDRVGRISSEPDVVLEWNAALSDHFEESSIANTPPIQARVYAMVHLAIRDATAVATRETPRDSAGAIAISAAGTAAYDVLAMLCPAGANRFDALQARHIAALANDGAATRGRPIGQRIAAAVVSSRAADGWPVAPFHPNAEKAGLGSWRTVGAKSIPFGLKRAQQFEPEPPYLQLDGDLLVPNGTLRKKKVIGTPADVASTPRTTEVWLTAPVLRWNRIAHALALARPQDLSAKGRLFATLNMALSDALLSATYWSDIYQSGRVVAPTASSLSEFHRALDAGETGPDLGDLWRKIQPLSGFPAVPAALGGAAEAVLRNSFGDAIIALAAKDGDSGSDADFTSLRATARQCAWADAMAGASTHEGCVAGYDLGSQIAVYLLRQDRR